MKYQVLNYIGQVEFEGTQKDCEKYAKRKSKQPNHYGYKVIDVETQVYDIWNGGKMCAYAQCDD